MESNQRQMILNRDYEITMNPFIYSHVLRTDSAKTQSLKDVTRFNRWILKVYLTFVTYTSCL